MSNAGPDLSVLICAYEQADIIPQVLKCYLQQETEASFEIIVCDDGSTPRLFESVHELAQCAERSIYWVWQQDDGFQAARNFNNGIRLARGKYLVFADGDMIPERDFLQKHLEAHRQPGRLVAGNRRWRSLSALNSSGLGEPEDVWYWLANAAAAREGAKAIEFVERRSKANALKNGRPWLAFWSCNISAERSQAVYFDEAFYGWGCEDTEFSYRLINEAGLEACYREDIVAYHLADRVSGLEINQSHEGIVAYLRNLCYMLDKWPHVYDDYPGLNLPFALDATGDRWHDTGQFDAASAKATIEIARVWLAEQGIYPANET